VNLNRSVRARLHFISLAQFSVGLLLAWGVGYAWLGNDGPLIAAGVVTLVIHAISWRLRGEIRGVWVTVLGLCGALSKIDPELSAQVMGERRLPVIIGGSALAILYGLLVEEPDSLRNLFGRQRTVP
jgi:hypothetical protein